ncbi:ECF-type sigma factor [Roseisolibacter sp. H3M3-2]|uniref:ECF-type sigma factor n=1 Tax=Roseisolibacter sp. H3M3-2 TaxID=3031323 RepID=UPI0023DBF4A0|nr:ECF-type sigma factor [Roseisolibacter sp. H3M3-2]MDF1504959.1 ECF-type sigma factor [Roseisolibacter sp. H3M3-2]
MTVAPPPADAAFGAVYDELRRLARRQLRREAAGHTLNTTALVHEAYLRLAEQRAAPVERGHFLSLAATAMRRILVDHARRHRAAKRGAGVRAVTLDDADALAADDRAELFVALDEALARLAALDARQARVVECRFFGGLTEEETAEALGIGLRTAKRDWAKARGWLHRALHGDAVA